MPVKAFKPLFKKSSEVITNVLGLIKGRVAPVEYSHVQRLLKNGAERDTIFVQGIVTGIQLAKMKKEALRRTTEILRTAVERAEKGVPAGKLFKKEELEEFEELLKGTFNLGARRRITVTLSKADGILLNTLVAVFRELT